MHLEFSNEESLRYSRHFVLPEVGLEGQRRLKAAKVVLVGAGGLGSPTALYLAASGVGRIGLVDFDKVDLTNLHRQIIHGTSDVGRSKLDSAEDSIRAVNPHVDVVKHETRLTSENALQILADYDYVVDGADNFPTRYLVNDACVLLGKRNMYGSIFRFDGQATVFCAPDGPCYRCLYPEPPPPGTVPSCAEGGVLGVLPGLVGLIQATETVKAILGVGDSLVGRLLMVDALGMRFREIRIRKDPDCPICGERRTITGLIDYESFCGLAPISEAPSLREIEAAELREMLLAQAAFTLLDVREPDEFAATRIPGSVLIPLGELPDRIGEVDSSLPVVVHCHSGMRSEKACAVLEELGFSRVTNLKGGIVEWLKLGV
ncbi:MAG: molybdopterin-synthase adenylyltransferase MoeB [Fimbriimonas sp.]|nr:molybdopterin-synthase adenylyltransferase MoeB [Fimbriimonas sp.]